MNIQGNQKSQITWNRQSKVTDIGIMSEAGLPGIADPGAKIIALAHKKNIKVIPLSGPSSIITCTHIFRI